MPKRETNFCPTTIVVDQNLDFHNGYRLLVGRHYSCRGRAGFFNTRPRKWTIGNKNQSKTPSIKSNNKNKYYL